MNREGKKCVLYPRVSTEMQVDGYSLEGQKNSLKRFADREEMEIVGIYEDAGKSGKSIEGRPAFKKMLSDIKNGLEIDYILVYKLSRFGRNAADILNSLEFVQSYGINLICIEEGIDSSQTSGKLLISVLSAVAEIERENIIEQTMNGRREKARQGGWNGGFAPYGYYLKDNQLLIEETEAEAIRIIFDKFANSDIGLGGVAKYLNLQGIKKIPRQNGTLETWSSHFIRLILDNPVYCGKIAYGRRTREKVKGTKNEYKQVHAEDYILEDGQHEGIISEELWQKVHAKRMATGIKQPSKIGKDRSHLLTGILKCPLCGSSMYTNKHAWTNKDGTYKEVYYYICGRNKQERGHHCDYKASLRKTDIEPLVIEAVKELVSDKYFAKEIEKRIGVQTDTTAIDKELANYESKLKEVDLNKARLEREIDNLPIDARFRERKIHDMTLRLDGLYDTIVELEERIEDAKLRKSSIEMETITLDNIYKLMLNFGKLYDIISDEEKKSLITYLIKEIQIYPNGESEQPLKSIEFNFPIYRDGQEVRRLLWEKGNTVELRPLIPVHIPVTGAVPQFQHTAAGEHQLPGGRLVFRHPRQLPAQKTQMIALQFRHGPPHQQNADAGVLQGHQHCLGPHCPALPATSGPAEGHILLFTLQKLLLPGVGPLQLHHLHAHLLHSSASFASTTFTVSGPLSVRSSSVTSSRSSAVSSLSSLASISSICATMLPALRHSFRAACCKLPLCSSRSRCPRL